MKMQNLSKAQMASNAGWGEGSCFRSAVLTAIEPGAGAILGLL